MTGWDPSYGAWLVGACLTLLVGCDWFTPEAQRQSLPPAPPPKPEPTVTFNRDIAPILLKNCVSCHRPGQSAPFSLLTYEEARSRASQIVEVTQFGYMPPWLPVEGHGTFEDERRLSPRQIAAIAQWVNEGAAEGHPGDLPKAPEFTTDWQLGRPDMVLKMPEPYTLPAAGRDVYRNFVIPIPIKDAIYVRGIEMRFDNPQIVHHAFALLDTSGTSRQLDLEDPQPGYDGMDAGDHAYSPGGQFISWQPGKVPRLSDFDMSYRVDPGTDLVLQVHMQPTGKTESLSAKLAIYLSPYKPTKFPFKIMLRQVDIDIPPGAAAHVVEDSYRLPVDVRALAVLPHAHYLGKSVEAFAIAPTGEKIWLLRIDDWDFNWQGDYLYKRPLFLPAGTTLHMRWTYDNSADNPRNPFNPPRRVTYGVQTVDEMGELWLQVLPSDVQAREVLLRDQREKLMSEVVTAAQMRLISDPSDFRSARRLYQALMMMERDDEAVSAAQAAVRLRPDSSVVNLEVGFLMFRLNRHGDAQRLLLRAIELDSRQAKPHYILGLSFLSTGEKTLGEGQLRAAIVLDPAHVDARNELGRLLLVQGNHAAAAEQFSAALRLAPHRDDIRANLSAAQSGQR